MSAAAPWAARAAPLHVVIVGQVPQPTHGQALANHYLVNGAYDHLRVHHVALRFSRTVADVSRFRPRKVLRLPGVIGRVWLHALVGHRHVLVFSVGMRNRTPLLRDAAVLLLTRPLFRHIVLHVHTGGCRSQIERLPRWLRPVVERAYGDVDLALHLHASLDDGGFRRPKRVSVLPYGVEDPGVPPHGTPSEHEPTVLFLGNLYPSKGTHLLVAAAQRLRERGVAFRLVFAGEAPDEGTRVALQDAVVAADLTEHVSLVGPLFGADKERALRTARLLCLPTQYEGEAMPLSVIEAMAHGVAVVASTWRALPALVEHGVTGFLVAPGRVEDLAERLQQLLVCPEQARAMGRGGRTRYEQEFSLPRFLADFERLVGGLEQAPPSARRLSMRVGT